MRSTQVCPKCRFNRILFVHALPDSHSDHEVQPMHAVLAYAGIKFLGGDKLSPVGHLTSCICRRCGYTELYTLGVEEIPIDGRYVQEHVGPDHEGPYR